MTQAMKQWLILISIDMWQLKITCMWKIKVSSVLSLVVNGEIHKEPNSRAAKAIFWSELCTFC